MSLLKESHRLAQLLQTEGLETELVCCRVGAVDHDEIGLPKAHPDRFAAICNPVAQARLLNERNVDLVAQVGLCVGHDLILQEECDAPVTTLVVKDRALDHHTVAALRSSPAAGSDTLPHVETSEPLAMLVVAPSLSLAQGGPPPGKGPGAMRLFDPATVVTVTGTVVGESRIDRGMGHSGVHLSVKTADGEIPVHLGPDFWVDKQTVKFANGDEITVKGSKITFEGKPAIIAVTVTKGSTTLVLRNEKGTPVWKGQGMGQGGK